MSAQNAALPAIGITIGDPCGVGPEVIAKAWADRAVHTVCRPILIGSADAMRQAVDFAGLSCEVQVHQSPADVTETSPEVIEIVDSGFLDAASITLGEDNEVCGRATGAWLDEADGYARSGAVAATVMGPISSVAMQMAGVLDRVIDIVPGQSYLVLVSGPLRVAHLTDHMPMREVYEKITQDLVESALHTLDTALRGWGIKNPRIAVAGFNAHAMGDEEKEAIAPAIGAAQASGINAVGPIPPDSVFRECLEGRYDMVLAMYHDQGHIAIKTWGFAGNCAILLGRPYLLLSVAHGTAFDIVGTGRADHSMMLSAILTAGSLAAGHGFR